MSNSSALDIVVLAGGISHERDVSLRSGRRVADALSGPVTTVTLRDPDATLLAALRDDAPGRRLAGPARRERRRRGAARPAARLGIPLRRLAPGCGRPGVVEADRQGARRRAGIATPASIALSRETFRELGADGVLERSRDGSGAAARREARPGWVGAGRDHRRRIAEDLPARHGRRVHLRDVALVEQQIVGTEIAIAVIDTGRRACALPAVEIEPLSGVYSFEARYNAGETTFYAPARLDEVAARAAKRRVRAHRTLGLRHLSRIDFIVDDDGDAVVPRGERAARTHRDLARPPGDRGRRARRRLGLPRPGRDGDPGQLGATPPLRAS